MTAPRRLTGLAAGLALLTLVMTATIPARAMNPAKIRGEVTSMGGSPLPELKFRLVASQAGRPPRTVTTKKDGTYRLAFIEWGKYTVEIQTPGWQVDAFYLEEKGQRMKLLEPLEGTLAPGQEFPEFELQPSHEYILNLVLRSEEQAERLRQEMEASGAASEVQAANEAMMAGDFEAAAAAADEVLAANPENGFGHYIKGMALLQLGRLPEAREALTSAVELLPEQPGVHFGLGTLMLEEADALEETAKADAARAKRLEAAAELEKELALSPGAVEVQTNLALAWYKGGELDKAAEAFQLVLETNPDDLNAYFALSDVYNQLDRPDEAMAVLERLPIGGRDAAVGFFNVAVNLFNEGNGDSAMVAVTRALEMDPEHARSHQLQGNLYLQKGMTAEALASFRRFLELAPEDPDAETTRALVEYLESQ